MTSMLVRLREVGNARVVPGLVWAIRGNADGSSEEIALDKPEAFSADGWYRLHFGLADNRVHSFFNALSISQATQMIREGEQTQQLQLRERIAFGAVADLQRSLEGAQDHLGYLYFAADEKVLITARLNSLCSPGAVRQSLQRGFRVPAIPDLLECILLEIIEGFDRRIETTGKQIDRIEDRIIAGIVKDARAHIGANRRTIINIHRHVSGLRTLMSRLAKTNAQQTVFPTLPSAAENVLRNSEQLEHEIISLRERARLLQEEVAAMLAEETNKHLRVLSILTILFIPPTFIGGLFGMNLKGILFAESEHGFLIACALAAASSGIVAWLLKRSGIWEAND